MNECKYRHENGNCLFVGGFCTSVDKGHCIEEHDKQIRAEVIEEFAKKLYEQENNINDANYGFNFVKKVIDEMKHHKVS